MKKYLAVFQLSATHALKNSKGLIGLSIFLITCMIIFAHLWKLAASKLGAIDFDSNQLLWYIAFNEWVLVSLPDIQEDMEQDLRSGRLAYLLPRPISYLGSTFAEALGALTVNLTVLGIVTFLFTWSQTESLPFHTTALVFVIPLGFLAGIVAILFQMLIGISAFWLQDISPVHWLWEKLLLLFGGLMLPLSIYPLWMQSLAYFTPFPAILGERSSLALGFGLEQIISVFLSLGIWTAIGLILLLFTYRKGLRVLTIEGG